MSLYRWLKRQRFTYSKIGRLVYMVEDHEHNLQPKIKWLKSINVHGSDLATALTRDPIVLEKTIHSLNENVELIKAAGVRSEWIGWVIRRCSKVLACNKEELQEHINFYTRLGIKDDNFGKMVYKFPACLARFSVEEMHSKVLYLKAFGLDDLALGKVIASKPQLIACSIEEDWKPLVKLFYFLGIDGYGLRKILTIQPSVFCLNIKDNIAPKVRFLRDVGVHEELIGDVLVKFPSFLSYSLDEKIRPCVMFLLEKAAVPVDKVGKVLSIQPDLLRCSISQKLDVIVRFFIFHGFKREQVGLMVTDFPMLLKYNLSSIKPKLSFALRVMKLPVEEVVKFPRIFSHSLESRIVPRYKILRKRGLNYNLRRMLACSDDEFMRSLDENGTNDVDTELEMEISVNADLSAETNIEISEQSDLESQFTARYIDDMPDLVMSGQLDVDTSEFRWDNAPNPGAYKVLNGENAVDAGVYEVFDGENLSDEYWHCEFFTDRVRK
ncbi:hypothetical protein KP509_10G060100 [Ceratopteris richardii]|uniref:Uncharacterized protein n=1 Tax=Ceratopteris richardii TaxID=49495 RepID=A0A8T2U5D6_CERRI|nr:hypothetical protein KP509_10G060100 [Ceratopteris richardii]